jgi:hypothetical protein
VDRSHETLLGKLVKDGRQQIRKWMLKQGLDDSLITKFDQDNYQKGFRHLDSPIKMNSKGEEMKTSSTVPQMKGEGSMVDGHEAEVKPSNRPIQDSESKHHSKLMIPSISQSKQNIMTQEIKRSRGRDRGRDTQNTLDEMGSKRNKRSRIKASD